MRSLGDHLLITFFFVTWFLLDGLNGTRGDLLLLEFFYFAVTHLNL
jgi:hypothetical protein